MHIVARSFLIATVVVGFAACKGGCPKGGGEQSPTAPTEQSAAPTTPGAAELSPEQIADSLSKAVCGRIVACNKEAGTTADDCAAGMAKDLSQALPDKAKSVGKTTLDGCIAAITSASCDDLNAPTPPKGCEFME